MDPRPIQQPILNQHHYHQLTLIAEALQDFCSAVDNHLDDRTVIQGDLSANLLALFNQGYKPLIVLAEEVAAIREAQIEWAILAAVRRWQGNIEKTRQATAKTERAIERLCQEGIVPSLIITLHRANATRDKLPLLQDWIHYLEGIGIRWIRLHPLESESQIIRAKYALTLNENIEALCSFAVLEKKLQRLKFDLFTDMRQMLKGCDENTTCIWNACDPYTTQAVRGVEGNGQRSNCGRTNKDGIDFVKARVPGFERYLALYATPQEVGGCKGCRFFLMCKGQCPGTAIDGDWRNRTEHCEIWKTLYTQLEEELRAEGEEPLSLSPNREQIEQIVLDAWSRGRPVSLAQVLRNSTDFKADVSFDWRVELEKLKRDFQEIIYDEFHSKSS
jgi:radical SAM protein with 4Fe4S-binding SPASM domain